MKNAVIGFPRIGENRELKFASEKFFRGEITETELKNTAAALRRKHWQMQKQAEIDWIPSNDFSFYDGMLDTVVMLGAIPKEYQNLGLGDLSTYFAMAHGYQDERNDVRALPMKKWFTTNYHYIVPKITKETVFSLHPEKILSEYREAKALGIETKPGIIGPYTFLKLSEAVLSEAQTKQLTEAYQLLLQELKEAGVTWLSVEEPAVVMDMCKEEAELFEKLYRTILNKNPGIQVILQTYFGDVRDIYEKLITLDFAGIGLDFVEGEEGNFRLIQKYGYPKDKRLFAGVINGRNIWKNHYLKTRNQIQTCLEQKIAKEQIVISTACSLLHVPYTVEMETELADDVKKHFAFAEEKLQELKELKEVLEDDNPQNACLLENEVLFHEKRKRRDQKITEAVNALKEEDFHRNRKRSEREKIQKKEFQLPLFPTTTIGSFPQTAEVKKNRAAYKKGKITKAEYDRHIKEYIQNVIAFQEKIGLDVLVHGEYERNDMVEFFGENLEGYVFTQKAWVQSYGTRCVKPPIIFSDIKRKNPITVDYAVYAQSLTKKPVKGMLTGPVTILNWSFPREDISMKEMAYQLALAIRSEVMDLEKANIKIIQIDEAALKEKLPLKRAEWYSNYLDWAILAFRITTAQVKETTQIHTHMCYSEFNEIVKDIDQMDADVISFEASRSNLKIIDALSASHFETEVGPGVYDIHSPRVPSVEEMVTALHKILKKVDQTKLWINPDCGLKTRGTKETEESLKNMVQAARILRKEATI